jgi:glycosyltransferase involved in cell wall biosynthesis
VATDPDIALVSLGTTPGLVRSDAAFASLVRAAGASCEITRVRIGATGALRRHAAVTDLVEAIAARRAARAAHGRAIVFSTITAALLQPQPRVPFAIRFDATAALNRSGPAGAWQRRAEQRPLRDAALLMPVSRGAEAALPEHGVAPVLRVPIPIEEIEGAPTRDIDAVAYAGYPRKRGLEVLCEAWAQAGPANGRFVIGGLDREKGVGWLRRCGVDEPVGVEWAGSLPRDEWLALVGRARTYVNASRWEDFGLGPLEALAAGTPLVTVPTPGSFEALPLARQLDAGSARLGSPVAADGHAAAGSLVTTGIDASSLAAALRAGLGLTARQRDEYATAARDLLAPYRESRVVELVRTKVLPALGVTPR